MGMDLTPAGAVDRAGPPAPPRTGAFADVRARWLALWSLLGAAALIWLTALVEELLGIPVPDELAGILLYLPMIAAIAVLVVRRGGVDLGAILRWPKLGWYWFAVAGLLVVQLLFSLAAIVLTSLVAPWLGDSLEDVGQGNLILTAISLVILPPLVEEVVFRGVLIERFTVKWRVGVAVILSAVFFGALHADPVGAGMFGVVTGLLYLRTGSLWPGIVIHAVNNLVAMVATRMSDPEAQAPDPSLSESLITAGALLAISLPFLIWFIVGNWPSRTTPTPYQRHEMVVGLPTRKVPDVRWSEAPGPLTMEVSSRRAVIGDKLGRSMAVLPLE